MKTKLANVYAPVSRPLQISLFHFGPCLAGTHSRGLSTQHFSPLKFRICSNYNKDVKAVKAW